MQGVQAWTFVDRRYHGVDANRQEARLRLVYYAIATDESSHGTGLGAGDKVHRGLYGFPQYVIGIVDMVQLAGQFAQLMREPVRPGLTFWRFRADTPQSAAIGHGFS
jgi:hypothetical protein